MIIPRLFVCVPRAVCASWWPRPWAEMLASAEAGVDGLVVVVDPKVQVPDRKSSEPNAMKDVDDYPYTKRGYMAFRQGHAFWDGAARVDKAMLHTQGW